MTSICMLLQNQYDGDVRVRRKAEALVAAGYSVDVVALRGAPGRASYVLNGVNVHTMALSKKRGTLARYGFEYLAFLGWAALRLARLAWKKRYAAIDVNTLPDFLIFAAAPARWLGAKLILDMHEITPEFYMSKYRIARDAWVIRALTWVERLSFRFADHVITIHEPIRDLLVGRGLTRARSTVIMNAVDEESFAPGPEPGTGRAEARRPFVMMYHGTLTRVYGLEVAIEAFAFAHDQMPGAELWILGDGPERRSLEALAREHGVADAVRILGPVPPHEVAAWVRQCDVGVLPMRRDVFLEYAFPNKLSEYIVLGKSVIIGDLKAIRHYFSADALALYDTGSAPDLAKQMVRLYEVPALRARLAARARHEYAAIRWDVMKARYLRLVAELAGERTAREPA